MTGRVNFLVVYLLLIATGLYLALHRDLGTPMKRPFRQFPGAVSRWQMTDEASLSAQIQETLKASDVLMRQYANEKGERVNLYIGYHDGGKESGEIHSPRNCLPGSGWFQVSSVQSRLPLYGGLNLVRAVYQKGETKELFLYWFQVRGESMTQEYRLKVSEILNSALYRRRDAALVRVSVPFSGSETEAAALADRFVSDFYPTIRSFLPS